MSLLDLIEIWFGRYGYLVLLVGLPLDAIALPIPPGNTTLAFTGYLVFREKLAWLPAIASAFAGAVLGMTVTYWLGYKLGQPLIERFGKRIFLKPAVLEKTRKYYDKYGNKLLLVCYFIPGVRQFAGYFVGILRVPYRTFALYAYTGLGLWVLVFTGIGYLFGEQWQSAFHFVELYLKYFFIALAGIAVLFILAKLVTRAKSR
jgi:membrane protein DedA with SNARE-associated domain